MSIFNYLFLFFWSFSALGIYLGEYFLNMPTVFLLLLSIFFIFFSDSVEKNLLSIFLVLATYCFLTTIVRHDLDLFVVSFLGFLALSISAIFNSKKSGVSFDVVNNIILFICILVLIEFLYRNLIGNIPVIDDLESASTTPYLDIERSKLLSREPSFLAFNLAWYRLMFFQIKELATPKYFFTRRLLEISLLLIFGLSAWIFLLVIVFFMFLSIKNKISFSIFIASIFIILALTTPIVEIFELRFERFLLGYQTSENFSSEMYRIGGFLVVFEMYNVEGISSLIFGLGYAMYDVWVMQNFAWVSGYESAFAQGYINALLYSLVLSVGIIGAFIFYLYIFKALNFNPYVCFIFFLYTLQSGELITAQLWGAIYIYRMLSNESTFSNNN